MLINVNIILGAPWVTLTLPIMVHAMERLWKFQTKGMVLELSSTTPKEAQSQICHYNIFYLQQQLKTVACFD
jgi:hypothetical protein